MIAPIATTRQPIGVAPWVAAALRKPISPGDLIHELAEALEDDILANPEVQEAEQKIHALLDRVEDVDAELAGELAFLIDLDHHCATVRATIAAILAREELATVAS
jgi:hypothetical protein